MKKQKEKIKGTIKENIRLMSTPLMSILPGQISFFVVLSIIPLFSILVMFVSKLSLSFDTVTNFFVHYLPNGVTDIFLFIIDSQKVGTLDIVFIITAFYLASKATHSIVVASTQIYNGKQRNFLRTRIKAIIMLIIIIILVIMIIATLTVGSRIVDYIAKVNGNISPYVSILYDVIKWPFVLFMIFFTVKVIYTIAPNEPIPSKSVNKGALLTTVIWGITTFLFSFYVTHLANYTKFYGNLSNLIILMIWIYWMCYVFVFGMTFNEYKLTEMTGKIKSLE
ncbi:MAG TPA: YihY/virulence factor BrkB family protein [Candidatus Aphodocola excrementigallinarum]|uniref:YihY/virulence factor BrkB family protein n=1 Tax=Candidatus Aphodocola excrementigallinarum TaxID=2840670 RepID=A0A9D1IPU0_9FIRM|nr:YihY/virulence factor BrkB family protein [Candidatus Aphodocola excrementigallinarum]